jgi:nuclear pore complex protein Nup133
VRPFAAKYMMLIIDHRHALLSQDKVYSGLVSRFFAESNPRYPELAWMHHLACKRYGEAASDLLVVNKEEQDLAQKHVSPSLNMLVSRLTGSC